ncbi:secreted antigen 1 [Babesia caballi]|uniref:Secreted antigen 1 n=1 Tax=Babesia caballi TaxID=5871 RepID=A0AAV4M119_BABCB|nr:secreted antigen 1 [Babesia caballi]
MAPARGCSLSVHVPNTLKEALEFLDALHNNFGGPQRAVVEELEEKIQNDGHGHISVAFQNVRESASELRLKLIGNNRLRSYGRYNQLNESHHSDPSCKKNVISVLVHILPRLLNTLKYLEPKVKNFDRGGWGREHFGGTNNGTDIHKWLTKNSPGNSADELPGGFGRGDLHNGVGNNLYTPLSNLVGGNHGHLQELWDRIKEIASDYPLSIAASAQSSPGQQQDNQRIGYPPADTQPSTIGAGSSTATIGGAVGATGLVGGGAAVYFLNVGGIRTLIAG